MTDLIDFLNTLLLTFRSVSVITQVLLIIVPPAFVLGVFALRIWSLNTKIAAPDQRGEMVFSSHRNADGTLTTYRHQRHIVRPLNTPPLVRKPVRDATMLQLVKYEEEREAEKDGEPAG